MTAATTKPEGHRPLSEVDPEIAELIRREERAEADTIRLIASENYVSRAVLEATGSVLTNKYSEGYPQKRYYEGQQQIDQVEELARSRMKQVFGADHVNVQPYSGSPANLAVYLAFVKPGETIMGLGLPAGGHLTHGWNVSITGKFFNSVPYGVRADDHRIDMDQVRELARTHRPKLIWCGTTAYPRTLDFPAFRAIADEVGAILAADIAHIAGLVAGGAHPSPIGISDVVTMTTHKTFRGPRGAAILCKTEHAVAIDRAVFPGLQGGPHNHTTAAIAVAAREAMEPSFKQYAARVVENARVLGAALEAKGFRLITGGTDNHLLLVDMTPKNIGGKPYAKALDRAGLVGNYNSIPNDPRKPMDPSGLRIGTPSISSRGMGPKEMELIAGWMAEVADHPQDEARITRIAGEVKELCQGFPAPGIVS
ncbi:serine hydroxymethyltransferase [Polyangium mundeleinium]|uniref:Serine hydroxymethyltransferase n=1 Tax=Polyangium mundeleinium TaxID=2995306 RepID=A0ABT5F235_9BACT|nr:serine hydroxymethyltransferase [Polyangium mundeleinium]MDC0747222.1 serine hydroxymethyltransferase [Polyangium mundeleinium]